VPSQALRLNAELQDATYRLKLQPTKEWLFPHTTTRGRCWPEKADI